MTTLIDAAKLTQLAHGATCSAQLLFGPPEDTARDYWDMRQAAALAIWQAWRAGKPDAYAFRAGRFAAIEWQRQWRGIKSHRTRTPTAPTFFAKALDAERHRDGAVALDDDYILSDELIEQLFALILNTRRVRGRKEIDGAVRAANIVRLLAAGYNNLGSPRRWE